MISIIRRRIPSRSGSAPAHPAGPRAAHSSQHRDQSRRKWRLVLGAVLLLACILLSAANYYIATAFDHIIYHDPARTPHNRTGLVLGTAKLVAGRPNLYYNARMAAAAELYHAGGIEKILVSGDNSRHTYDEATDMKMDLVARGVDPRDIYLDYAGFRTLDSIVRAKEVFGLTSLTIISQPFHCERALFIARAKGLTAVGFAAADIRQPSRLFLTLRETVARGWVVLDLWVLHTEPKFLGEAIEIR